MKILVCGWRPWSVVARYRSLMLNAMELGHDVLGIASRHLDAHHMTVGCFEELGVPCEHGDRQYVKRVIKDFAPDAVFGEQHWNCPEEVVAKKWAVEHGRGHFVLDHGKNYHSDFGPAIKYHRGLGGRSTILTATERATEILEGEMKAKLVLVGMPQYDFEEFDIPAIRERLGVEEGQKLIGVSMTMGETGDPPTREAGFLNALVKVAERNNWKLVCSPHPTERSRHDALKHPKRRDYLRKIQDSGIQFVSDFAPGEPCGVRFEQCGTFEMIAAADGLTGSSETFAFPAYALGKWYHPYSERTYQLPDNIGTLGASIGGARGSMRGLVRAVEQGDDFEQDERVVREFFYKLDGKCWKRILDLVEEAEDGHGHGV